MTSERDSGGEQARAGRAAGEHAAELHGIESKFGAAGPCDVAVTRGSAKREREWLSVPSRPFRDNVRDDAPVVIRRELDIAIDGATDVDAMDPRIARVDEIEEIAHGPLVFAG